MNKQEIQQHKQAFDQAVHYQEDSSIKYCLARELMIFLDYGRWKYFNNVLKKTEIACQNSMIEQAKHFRDVTKMVGIESEIERLDTENMVTSSTNYFKIRNTYFPNLRRVCQ